MIDIRAPSILPAVVVAVALAAAPSCSGSVGTGASAGGKGGGSAPADAGQDVEDAAYDALVADAGQDGEIPDASMWADVPRIDQLAWYAELTAKRKDIVGMTTPTTGSPCYEGMMIKQKYRAMLLGSTELPTPFEQATYTTADKQADETWIASQQATEVSFCDTYPGGGCHSICTPPDAGADAGTACAACPGSALGADAGLHSYYVSGYGLCGFVGYKEGPDVDIYDANGLVWLVYFELADVEAQLTAALLQTYASELAAHGFQGDVKTLTDPRLPQQARYQYNDVIVHGHSEYDGELAEAVGLLLFGPHLTGVGRGLDVQNEGEWSAYICTEKGNVSALPPAAVAYTKYQ